VTSKTRYSIFVWRNISTRKYEVLAFGLGVGTEAINLIQALLLISEVGDKKKEYYLKLIHQQL
jgi:hypothetical protein